MKKIHGYNISLWALMFHMSTQSKYVVESETEINQKSFMYPIALELKDAINDVLTGKSKLSYDLTDKDREEIAKYMEKHIDPVVKTRRVRPAILLLATLNEMYNTDFKPSFEIIGTTDVKEFIEECVVKTMESKEISGFYYENCKMLKTIIEPTNIPFGVKNKINKFKKEFEKILEETYGNSQSHGWEHIDDVLLKAIYFKNKYNVKVDEDELILAVLFHDIYSAKDRKNHHNLAAYWVESSIHPLIDSIKDRKKRIAMAIREHRASYVGDFFSPLSEILATADREKPDLIKIIERIYRYTIEHNPNLSHKEIMNEIVKHLTEKYSANGYSSYTNMYMIEYLDELMSMFLTIDKIINKKLVIKISNISNKLNISIKRK